MFFYKQYINNNFSQSCILNKTCFEYIFTSWVHPKVNIVVHELLFVGMLSFIHVCPLSKHKMSSSFGFHSDSVTKSFKQIIWNFLSNAFDHDTQAKLNFIIWNFFCGFNEFKLKYQICDFYALTSVCRGQIFETFAKCFDHNTQAKFNSSYYIFYGSRFVPL